MIDKATGRYQLQDSQRYILVQCAGYSIDVGGFFILHNYFGISPLLANLVCKPIAAFFAFIIHRTYTFNQRDERGLGSQAIKYIILLLINIQINSLFLIGYMCSGMPIIIARISADVTGFVLTYFALKHLVFRR